MDGILSVSRAFGDIDFKQAGGLGPEKQAVTAYPGVPCCCCRTFPAICFLLTRCCALSTLPGHGLVANCTETKRGGGVRGQKLFCVPTIDLQFGPF